MAGEGRTRVYLRPPPPTDPADGPIPAVMRAPARAHWRVVGPAAGGGRKWKKVGRTAGGGLMTCARACRPVCSWAGVSAACALRTRHAACGRRLVRVCARVSAGRGGAGATMPWMAVTLNGPRPALIACYCVDCVLLHNNCVLLHTVPAASAPPSHAPATPPFRRVSAQAARPAREATQHAYAGQNLILLHPIASHRQIPNSHQFAPITALPYCRI